MPALGGGFQSNSLDAQVLGDAPAFSGPCLSLVGQVRVSYFNGRSAYTDRSRFSQCAILSTTSMVATLTVHTRRSRSMTRSL